MQNVRMEVDLQLYILRSKMFGWRSKILPKVSGSIDTFRGVVCKGVQKDHHVYFTGSCLHNVRVTYIFLQALLQVYILRSKMFARRNRRLQVYIEGGKCSPGGTVGFRCTLREVNVRLEEYFPFLFLKKESPVLSGGRVSTNRCDGGSNWAASKILLVSSFSPVFLSYRPSFLPFFSRFSFLPSCRFSFLPSFFPTVLPLFFSGVLTLSGVLLSYRPAAFLLLRPSFLPSFFSGVLIKNGSNLYP